MNRDLLSTILRLLDDLFRLRKARLLRCNPNLFADNFFTLLNISHLRRFNCRFRLKTEYSERRVAMGISNTTLMFNFERRFTRNLRRAGTLVSGSRFRTIRTATARPLRRISPANLILFRTLNNAWGLAVSILVSHSYRRSNRVFGLSAPITTRVSPVRVSVQVPPTLREAIAPVLSISVHFLIRLASNKKESLATPRDLNGVLCAPSKCTDRMRLGRDLFRTALPTTVPLGSNDLGKSPLRLKRLRYSVPEDNNGITIMITTTMTLTLLVTLMPNHLNRLLHFNLRRLIRNFLCTSTRGFLRLPLSGFFI